MKAASLLLFVFVVATAGAQASALSSPAAALPAAAVVEVGFPATRCKSLRMSETQRRHCDKAVRKAASKGLARGV